MKSWHAFGAVAWVLAVTAVSAACGAGSGAPEASGSQPSLEQTSTPTVAAVTSSTTATPVHTTDAGTPANDAEPAPPLPAPMPPGLNPVGVVEALGGRLVEGAPPVYPPAFVESCWDGFVETYYLYVVDPGVVDIAVLEPHLGGAALDVVSVDYTRDQLQNWEEQAHAALRDGSILASVNLSAVAPAWPSGDRFCSPTGPYLEVEVHDGTPTADLATVLPFLPPELVLVVHGEESVFLSSS